MEYPKLEKETASALHGLVDEFEQRLKILKQLGEKTGSWGAMITHWMCSKLDMRTLQLWEDHAASVKDQHFSVLVEFLEKRTRVLDAVSSNAGDDGSDSVKSTIKRQKVSVHTVTEDEKSAPMCYCCGGQHYLSRCPKFTKMALQEKLQFVNSKRLCSNCLRSGHWVRECNSKFNCRTCGRKHNTEIHPGFPLNSSSGSSGNNPSGGTTTGKPDTHAVSASTTASEEEPSQGQEEEAVVNSCSVGSKGGISNIFLSTVVLMVKDQHGVKHLARALLDNGSQANIMSERLRQILKLKRRPVNVPICGVGQSEAQARYSVHTAVSSRVTDFTVGVDFLILQRVTTDLPSVKVPVSHWKIPPDVQLADPEFNISSRIDLLLGAEHFYRFLYERELKRIPLGPGLPVLIQSVFGWIVTGKSTVSHANSVNCCVATTSYNLQGALEMQEVTEKELPHNTETTEANTTSNVRVVFDGSVPTDTEYTSNNMFSKQTSWPNQVVKHSFTGEQSKIRKAVVVSAAQQQVNSSFSPSLSFLPLLRAVAQVQDDGLSEDKRSLKNLRRFSAKSRLKLLCPFLDGDGISDHHHHQAIYESSLLILSVMRQDVWPIHSKRAALLKFQNYCKINPPPILQQLTGQLTETRICPSRPPQVTDVDYCGLFHTKPPHHRAISSKFNISCFARKTLYHEIASNLYTAPVEDHFEHFSAFLVQITAALNSRPLKPLSNDFSEFEALAPAHIHIRSAVIALPEPDAKNTHKPPYALPTTPAIVPALLAAVEQRIRRTSNCQEEPST